jgi:uncharacterized coiled-coil protein SlyX
MKYIFALYPYTRGYTYACIELSNELIDCGIVTAEPSSKFTLDRIKGQLEKYAPHIVVVRDGNSGHQEKRINNLVNHVTELAVERGVPVFQYTREQVRFVFEKFGAVTRQEIAEKIIEWIPMLASRRPRKMRPYQHEDYNLALFDAVALAVAYGYLDM